MPVDMSPGFMFDIGKKIGQYPCYLRSLFPNLPPQADAAVC